MTMTAKRIYTWGFLPESIKIKPLRTWRLERAQRTDGEIIYQDRGKTKC